MRNDVEQHTLSSYLGTLSLSLKHPFSNDPVDFHLENRDKRSVKIHSSFLNVSLGLSRICFTGVVKDLSRSVFYLQVPYPGRLPVKESKSRENYIIFRRLVPRHIFE